MIGAIAGDIVGSVYEGRPIKTTAFELFHPNARFTDDTVLTVAVADAILTDRDYASSLKRFGRRYPQAGYGGTFYSWLFLPESEPYGSWGNGSTMRVSPVGFAFSRVEDVLEEAKRSAAVTPTPKASRARRPPPWRSFWPAPARARREPWSMPFTAATTCEGPLRR